VFWDVHSHVVPSGDDGAQSFEEGLALCHSAAEHGTSVLFATPHVWPTLTLTPQREDEILASHSRLAERAAEFDLDLRLGYELTPSRSLLEEDPVRYRLGSLAAVLMEVPFHGSLGLAEALAEHIEGAGLTPVIAHPERSERVIADHGITAGFQERGWLMQVNATSLLGFHGADIEATAWALLGLARFDLVGSDGHRSSRPAHLDEAFRLVEARVGETAARRLFDGSALAVAAG
jgi:protein-tyrosine phosphatase